MKSIISLPLSLLAASPILALTQGISTTLLNRFIQMSTLCMSTYINSLCLLPGGLPKVGTINNAEYDIHGWVLHDHATREIIAVFRGTESLQNWDTDTNYTLASFDTLPECVGCKVHGGYYLAWEAVMDDVRSLIQEQTRRFPGYGVVITGHRYYSSLPII
jgi:hypothetical protein